MIAMLPKMPATGTLGSSAMSMWPRALKVRENAMHVRAKIKKASASFRKSICFGGVGWGGEARRQEAASLSSRLAAASMAQLCPVQQPRTHHPVDDESKGNGAHDGEWNLHEACNIATTKQRRRRGRRR